MDFAKAFETRNNEILITKLYVYGQWCPEA